jgi:pimeloyl-ACP methyl ester carboxylesterase
MTAAPRLFLFTGLNRRAEIFRRQVAAIPGAEVVAWPGVRPRETLGRYAQRLAGSLSSAGPCYLAGCSFGGPVALEVACRLPALACFLIASVRSPTEFPGWMRAVRAVPGVATTIPLSAGVLESFGLPRGASAPERAWRAWAAGALLGWRPDPRIARVRVRTIHGGRDRTFPLRHVRAEEVVPDGGHVLPVSHAEAVTRFLLEGMAGPDRSAAGSGPGGARRG